MDFPVSLAFHVEVAYFLMSVRWTRDADITLEQILIHLVPEVD